MKKVTVLFLCALPLAASGFTVVDLQPQTVAAFDHYLQTAEERLESQGRARRLWLDAFPDRRQLVDEGKVLAEPASGSGTVQVPGGLIQDWVGAMFVPGATLDQVLVLVQDYDLQQKIYKPDVIRSRLLSRTGNSFIVSLRLLKKKATTVTLDVTEAVQYYRPAPEFAYNICRATRIAEVENAGQPDERELEPGKDHGFLWRMNSYWRFARKDGGVYVESEVITLTRDIPAGLGWAIKPIVRLLPRDGLVQTLTQTRDALKQR